MPTRRALELESEVDRLMNQLLIVTRERDDARRELQVMKNARDEQKRSWQEYQDLKIVVKDQRRHIASLEEQLTPFLVHIVDGEQESML